MAIDKMLPFEPVRNSLIVRIQKIKTTQGGIALPEEPARGGRGTMRQALVLAVGPGNYVQNQAFRHDSGQWELPREPMPCKVGDVILYTGIAGLEFGEELRSRFDKDQLPPGDEIILIRDVDVVAVLKTEE